MHLDFRHDGRRVLLDLIVLRPAPATDLTSSPARALLDTGANVSGVSGLIAKKLDLPARGKLPIQTAGGLIQATRYLFRFGFEQDGSFPYIVDDLLGFELINSDVFDVVLGMDVLRRCDLMLKRDGTARLTLP